MDIRPLSCKIDTIGEDKFCQGGKKIYLAGLLLHQQTSIITVTAMTNTHNAN